MTIRIVSLLLLLLSMTGASAASAQDHLQKAKDLYAAAAYEEALAVLAAVPNPEGTPQIGQYRVFCLIALGQQKEAQQAIEGLLKANPLYMPDPVETSPRVVEAFTTARARALPDITKQMYLDSKAALERKDRQAAVTGFQMLLRTIDAAEDMTADFEDLRVLADGFLDLSRALPEPPVEPAPGADEASAATTPAEPPPPVVSTRPLVLEQELPPWTAYDGLSRRHEFAGTLRVRIGTDGRVQSAELIRPVHPAYDPLLLRATESWLYQPATENGVAVPSDLVIQVQLRPPGI
ncbi:MAG TPA: energy transducer TonB [Vicinamibacterales bacterium]|nr:energy transducer TonB [Vicinamibacterales bacterium]